MMKNYKNGFSLGEILIALGIISILATLGFSISKSNIENAYKQYFYTGYVGLQSALTAVNDREDLTLGTDASYKYIAETIFRGSYSTAANGSSTTITAPNNIKYQISKSGNNFKILMSTPGANNRQSATLYYIPDEYDFVMVGGNYASRVDLFPFFIDDGIAGRVRQQYKQDPTTNEWSYNSPEYKKRTFYSFKNAFCKVNPGITVNYDDSTEIIKCDGTTTTEYGAIRIANPKKVF